MSQDAKERMREYRLRRRHGISCVEVQLGRAEVDRLIATGYLPSDKRQDRNAIGWAVSDFMVDRLHRPE